jgi:hypothetical protein
MNWAVRLFEKYERARHWQPRFLRSLGSHSRFFFHQEAEGAVVSIPEVLKTRDHRHDLTLRPYQD